MAEFWRNLWQLIDAAAARLSKGAEARGFELLLSNLSPAQREQFTQYDYFDVVGCDTGVRYRIRKGHFMNVERLDKRGKLAQLLCFGPEGNVPVGDVLLAQKLALELFESEALQVANVLPPRVHNARLRYSIEAS